MHVFIYLFISLGLDMDLLFLLNEHHFPLFSWLLFFVLVNLTKNTFSSSVLYKYRVFAFTVGN